MKYTEIKAMSDEELVQRLAEEKSSLDNLKFAHSVTPLENPSKISHSRKVIARIHTEISARKKSI